MLPRFLIAAMSITLATAFPILSAILYWTRLKPFTITVLVLLIAVISGAYLMDWFKLTGGSWKIIDPFILLLFMIPVLWITAMILLFRDAGNAGWWLLAPLFIIIPRFIYGFIHFRP